MEQIKEFRNSIGLTINEFAREIKVSKSLHEKIESGARKPSREYITKLKSRYPQFDTNLLFAKQ